MKRRFAALLFAICLTMALVPNAAADQLQWAGVNPGVVAGVYYSGAAYNYNDLTTNTALKLVCDDLYGAADSGTYTQLAMSSANLNSFKFASGWVSKTVGAHTVADASTAYMMAGWLALKIFGDPNDASHQWAALNWAIWSIFANAGPMGSSSDGSTDADVASWLDKAYSAVQGLTLDNQMFSNLRVWVPADGSMQENMGFVPEPATMILLGTGLVGLAGRKKLLKVRG